MLVGGAARSGCIEQSYRNRIEELARSFPEQGHERLGRADVKRPESQLEGGESQNSALESPRQPINSVTASRSTNLRSVGKSSWTGSTKEVSRHSRSSNQDDSLEHRARGDNSRNGQRSGEQQGLGTQIRHSLRDHVNCGLVARDMG